MSKGYKITALLVVVVVSLTFAGAAEAGVNLSRALKNPGFKADRTSIAVVDAQTGQVLASHLPNLKLNPASCAKIITATAALASLGPDYRFQTDFYSDRKPNSGTVGKLYVRGTGDPKLVSEELWRMARNLHTVGLRHVTDGIVIDNTYFDSHEYPRKAGAGHRAYAAKTAALGVNFNAVTVRVAPAAKSGQRALVTVDPPVDYFKLVNKVTTGGKTNYGITLKSKGATETIVASGRISKNAGPQYVYRSISNPVAYAGSVIKYIFAQNGITVTGPVISGRTPQGAYGLTSEKSKPLGQIVRDMNKFSNNFIAEQLTKSLGAIRYGRPGSTVKGVRAIGDYLKSIGIESTGYTIENGSGLSDSSRISAMMLAKTLVAAYHDFAVRPEIVSSFSIFGVDGTMRKWKFQPQLRSRVRAKTGTLGGVSSLAGYVPMADGRIAAFAILANGLPRGPYAAHKAQMEVVRAISEGSL